MSLKSFQESIPWQLKVVVLILGQFWHPLGTFLLLTDGWFHYSSSLSKLKKESPDWIVARQFGKKGLSEFSHKVMGAILLVSSFLFIWFYYLKGGSSYALDTFYFVYTKMFYPAFLIMITAAILLKYTVQNDPGVVAIL